jgi:hypothetical protein
MTDNIIDNTDNGPVESGGGNKSGNPSVIRLTLPSASTHTDLESDVGTTSDNTDGTVANVQTDAVESTSNQQMHVQIDEVDDGLDNVDDPYDPYDNVRNVATGLGASSDSEMDRKQLQRLDDDESLHSDRFITHANEIVQVPEPIGLITMRLDSLPEFKIPQQFSLCQNVWHSICTDSMGQSVTI